MDLKDIIKYLKEYDGPEIKIMEVCGTHTASIFKSGIRSVISGRIRLISGPGCPVCVTPTAYIDKCMEYALKPGHVLLTFGDMMKVPGTSGSLSLIKGDGARVELMYSPSEVIAKAKAAPDTTYVIAAVGFETTVPTYALVMEEAIAAGLSNIKLLTALKTIVPPLDWICGTEPDIGGFICPGHVSVIVGSQVYEALAEKYHKPFVVAGFEPEQILAVIYDIVRQIGGQTGEVHNLYSNVVRTEGNVKARNIIDKYFSPGPAMWRGLGIIPDSGLYIRGEFQGFDAGSFGLDRDAELNEACRCGEVIIGRADPSECPMFGTACTPQEPYGPCMVSSEGACGIWYKNRGGII